MALPLEELQRELTRCDKRLDKAVLTAAMPSCGLIQEQEAQSLPFTMRNLHRALSIALVLNTEHTLFGFQSIKL